MPGDTSGVGGVAVVYGTGTGPNVPGNQFIQQGPGAPGLAEDGDEFGGRPSLTATSMVTAILTLQSGRRVSGSAG